MRFAAALVSLFCLLVVAPAAHAQPAPLRVVAKLQANVEPVRIVAFGDSITGVYYHTGGRRAWCDMLGIALGRLYPRARLEMFNAGISGNTSAAGLARIDRDVLARRPHLVVVMFGMNDAAGAQREQFAANLRTIIGRCRESGAEVVLCTPNNVYENPRRPIERLASFAQAARDVARQENVPLADCYQAYVDLSARDPLAWKLLMSETIHPSMNGHKLFAEVIARAICGRSVSLADVPPPADGLRFAVARLRARQPVNIVAMPPYDRLIPAALRQHFPGAQLSVTAWPTVGRPLAELEQWARSIRKQAPHLVVVAVPADAAAGDDESYVRSYAWILNWSIDFGVSRWDRLAVLPSVTARVTDAQRHRQQLAQQVIRGADSPYLDRPADDQRPTSEIVAAWIRHQIELAH